MKIEIPSSYDVIGDIAILKFDQDSNKKKVAKKLLKERKNIRTVVEKVGKIEGKLRTLNVKWLAGEKKTETIHTESGCKFKLDIEECYFSPRLSNERLEVAEKIKGGEVLVMFSGVGPYPIIIAKKSKPKRIVSIELGKKCCEYARENVKLNKVFERVEVIQGDVRKEVPKLKDKNERFDIIAMPRPRLKETFLQEAFKVLKKKGKIIYYGFGKDIEEIKKQIREEAKKAGKKINFLESNTAGNIAPYKFRYRIIFSVV